MGRKKIDPDLKRMSISITLPRWIVAMLNKSANQSRSSLVENAIIETYGKPRVEKWEKIKTNASQISAESRQNNER